MSQTGMGVMIKAMFGGQQAADIGPLLGQRIRSITLVKGGGRHSEDALVIEMQDGHRLRITDEGQSCCESRYMTCDDDLATYVGATLVDITVESGPDLPGYGEDHEQRFLRVSTDLGTVVVCTHNEHNGYYGGFWIQGQVIAPDTAVV
jgi:hypothetical protein